MNPNIKKGAEDAWITGYLNRILAHLCVTFGRKAVEKALADLTEVEVKNPNRPLGAGHFCL
jgi:hypothetical protein